MREKGVPGVASFFKHTISQFGPFVNKKLCWVSPLPPSIVPGRYELVREDCDVTWLAAASTLLCVWSLSVDRMFVTVDPDVGPAVGCVTIGFPDDRLALSVSPGGRNDDGGRLEEGSVLGGLVQHVGTLVEKFLQKKKRKKNVKNYQLLKICKSTGQTYEMGFSAKYIM